MTNPTRLALAFACSVALLAQAGVAQACSCPKAALIKRYGTVWQLHPFPPLPPPLPPAKAGTPANG